MKLPLRILVVCFLLPAAVSGCGSHHVEITVENRSGSEIRLLEIDYPNASFGEDRLAARAEFRYRIQVDGTGPVRVQYTSSGGHQVTQAGPTLTENNDGSLEIILLPEDRVQFRPRLGPKR